MNRRYLLDTHALLWWAHEPARLSAGATEALTDGENEMFVSAVSAMEIATKVRLRKLESSLDRNFIDQVTEHGLKTLSITAEHAQLAGNFVDANQDPWDRLLAAQAQLERLTLVSCDRRMNGFGVTTLW